MEQRFIVTIELNIPSNGLKSDLTDIRDTMASLLEINRYPFIAGMGMKRGRCRVLLVERMNGGGHNEADERSAKG